MGTWERPSQAQGPAGWEGQADRERLGALDVTLGLRIKGRQTPASEFMEGG